MEYMDILRENHSRMQKGEVPIDHIAYIQNLYQDRLTEFSIKNFGRDLSKSEYDEIWCDAFEGEVSLAGLNDIYIAVFFSYRNYVLKKVLSGELEVVNENSLIRKIDDYSEMEEKVKENFSDLLSMVGRKRFDYFINRYFFLDENVKYKKRYEKKIANVLGLRMEYFMLRIPHIPLFRQPNLSKLKVDPNYYPYYLMTISWLLLIQIGNKNEVFHLEKAAKLSAEIRSGKRLFWTVKFSIVFLSILSIIMLILDFLSKGTW